MPIFVVPAYEAWAVGFTALGAAVSFQKLSKAQVRTFALSPLMDMACRGRLIALRPLLEFLIFVALGVVVGIAVTNPSTPMQALAAGFGWTGLVGRYK